MAIRTIHTRYADAVNAERMAWVAFQSRSSTDPDYDALSAAWRSAAERVRDLAIELAAAPDFRGAPAHKQGTGSGG